MFAICDEGCHSLAVAAHQCVHHGFSAASITSVGGDGPTLVAVGTVGHRSRHGRPSPDSTTHELRESKLLDDEHRTAVQRQ
jgi:hypothetical protein